MLRSVRQPLTAICLCSSLLLSTPGPATEPPGQATVTVSNNAYGSEVEVSARGLEALAYRDIATVLIDGAAYTVTRDPDFEFPGYPSWIGWSDVEEVALVVTESPFGHELTVLRDEVAHHGTVAQAEKAAFAVRDAGLHDIADAHRLAIRLAQHRAKRVRLDRVTGRVERLRGRDIAQVQDGRLVLSNAFLETLGLKEHPQFEPASPPGVPHQNRITQHFKQRIHDIPVNSYISVEFYGDSGEVWEISGPVQADWEVPAPAESDATASQAATLLADFARNTLGDGSAEATNISPLKQEYLPHKGSLRLGWSGRLTVGSERFLVFLDAKTGEVLYNHAERRHRPRPADGARDRRANS